MIRINPLENAMSIALAVILISSIGVGYAGDIDKKGDGSKPAEAASKDAPPIVHMALEPKAIELLKGACSRLAASRAMSFTAVVTYENPSRLGTPLAYTTKSEVTMQRPDKLRVITPGDGPASEFYYNGKTLTAFAPTENLVAVADAPPTIDAALKVAYDSAAIYFPFTDLVVADPYQDIAEGLVLAFYIGQSKVVGGTVTEMIAYANNDVFVQAWIGAEDRLPRMVRAVYRADPVHLRHQMELSNWKIDPAVPSDSFATAKTAGAKPMPFAHPNTQFPSVARPHDKDEPLKTKGADK